MPSYIGAPWSVLIDDNTVTTAKLVADCVNGTKIADDAIDSEHYVDGSIDTAHIAASQVTTAKIADDAITGAKIALFDDSLAATTTHFLIADGTDYSSFALSGHATCTNGGSVSIAAACISGQSELAAETPAATDMFLMFDASATALKKISAFTLGLMWTAVAGNITMVEGGRYLVDTSSARTLTLPASPAIGDQVRIVDGTGAAATNNITVGRASQNIQGAAADLTIGANRAGIGLVFYNATHGWVLTEN